MLKIPIKTHIINFSLKYSLFLIGFYFFSRFELLTFPNTYIILIPLFFTFIGIIADWLIVPKFHNIPSATAGAFFMGFVTYFIPIIFDNGYISIVSTIILAIYLGIIEITLHHVIVKPYLSHS